MASSGIWSSRDGHLRCSDTERERVADFLRDHAAEGRLSPDELGDRLGLAYRAVTIGDLERLTGDLPGSPLDAGRPSRPSGRAGPTVVAGGAAAALAALLPGSLWILSIVGVVLAMTVAVTVLAVAMALAPFLLAGAAAVYAVRRLGGRRGLRSR
jgi:hypothetical protein